MLEQIHWLGHDVFRIDGPQTIYFDPDRLREGYPKADVILSTHEHRDHCSPEDILEFRQMIRAVRDLRKTARWWKLKGTPIPRRFPPWRSLAA
jgi:L-ascorbate metabolism protein UlaG (beta-lactamase superfamily)